ncbi:hypothetical protein D3C87_1059170 [compost metagenome]
MITSCAALSCQPALAIKNKLHSHRTIQAGLPDGSGRRVPEVAMKAMLLISELRPLRSTQDEHSDQYSQR